ncbi:MAG: hypothetical protein H7222_17500 [Methylotenera sp.]|nr:hypothetical protein [Oligoflexia bacterium]
MSLDLSTFSFSSLMAGFVFGVIGWSAFRHGRRRSNMPLLIIGLAMMIYPYFTDGPWLDWGVGTLLCIPCFSIWNR